MNFAIMYDTNDGRIIKTFDELSEAQYAAQNVACMGFSVTIFDYDQARFPFGFILRCFLNGFHRITTKKPYPTQDNNT